MMWACVMILHDENDVTRSHVNRSYIQLLQAYKLIHLIQIDSADSLRDLQKEWFADKS